MNDGQLAEESQCGPLTGIQPMKCRLRLTFPSPQRAGIFPY